MSLDVTIVTGMSGAGRSEAADVLEDLGFFVIDNLPPALIGKVAELARGGGRPHRYGLVVDVRSGVFIDDLAGALADLRASGASTRVLFLDASDEMFRTVSNSHTAEFLEIGVTMPQAKTLHLVAAEGRIRMSVLATRLGVTLSTVSGLVERLVEAGCVARHDDPVDRRQVVVTLTPEGDALIERFRDLNRSQLRSLLVLLSDDDLDAVERAVTALTRAAERRSASQPLATSERESS